MQIWLAIKDHFCQIYKCKHWLWSCYHKVLDTFMTAGRNFLYMEFNVKNCEEKRNEKIFCVGCACHFLSSSCHFLSFDRLCLLMCLPRERTELKLSSPPLNLWMTSKHDENSHKTTISQFDNFFWVLNPDPCESAKYMNSREAQWLLQKCSFYPRHPIFIPYFFLARKFFSEATMLRYS